MALPLIDIPFIGLSLSAPIFFIVAFYAIFKSQSHWYRSNRLWIILAIFIWLGTFLSAVLNGLFSGGININRDGYLSIIRVAYWLLVFVVTIYFAGQYKVITKTALILGLMVFFLGVLRWGEILLFGNFGAWSGTRWMSQNSYGFLFSTFSPFLLVLVFQSRGKKRFLFGAALILLWGAVAVNGSRGSWVAIASGIALMLLLFLIIRVRMFVGVSIGFVVMVSIAIFIFIGIPQVSDAVLNRFDTLYQIEQDKSYVTRLVMNQKAIRLFAESPFIGVGPSRFRLSSTDLDVPSLLRYVPFAVSLGKDIKVTIPKLGDKKRIVELSQRNAKYYRQERFKQIQIVDPDRHTNRIMKQMQKDLRLKVEPRHIECFDNSNIQGTNPVAACVVFRNGKPFKKDYRHFNIKTVVGPDDFASMEEVVHRRYKRLLEEDKELPQLIIIDGGKGQLSSALKSLDLLGLRGKIAIIGIAKRLEEIYYPGDPVPMYLDKKSESLKIIQQLRNEAHRFGINHHRNKRSKSAIKSELENIPGIGEKTRIQLLHKFKSVKRVGEASLDDLENTVGSDKSKKIYNYFHPDK